MIGPLTDVISQCLRGFIGLKHRGQKPQRMQALNPLAIALVGFWSPFNLPGKLWRRDERVEPHFDECEK